MRAISALPTVENLVVEHMNDLVNPLLLRLRRQDDIDLLFLSKHGRTVMRNERKI